MTSATFQLSLSAKKDLQKIIDYTIDSFGLKQAKKYVRALEKCADNLSKGHLSRSMPDVTHITFIKCEHHYIFGFSQKKEPFYIVAILHEKMDFMQRLKDRLSR